MKNDHEETADIDAVLGEEVLVVLHGAHEREQEGLVHEKFVELAETRLDGVRPLTVHFQVTEDGMRRREGGEQDLQPLLLFPPLTLEA